MIEKTILDYLNAQLSVSAYMEKPEKNIPASYVLIEKTGGKMENQIWSAVIAVQSIANTLYNAAVLNETVIEKMLALPNNSAAVSKCSLNSNYNFTDATTKQYRYQAVFDVVF